MRISDWSSDVCSSDLIFTEVAAFSSFDDDGDTGWTPSSSSGAPTAGSSPGIFTSVVAATSPSARSRALANQSRNTDEQQYGAHPADATLQRPHRLVEGTRRRRRRGLRRGRRGGGGAT